MPRYKTEGGHYHTPPDIVRYIRYLYGRPRIRFRYQPRLNYARGETRASIVDNYLKATSNSGQYESVYLYSSLDLEAIRDGAPIAVQEDGYILLSYNQKLLELNLERILLELERTRVYWLDWRSARWSSAASRSGSCAAPWCSSCSPTTRPGRSWRP